VADRQRFVKLRAQDKSLSTISKEIGVSRQTLANWQRDHEEEIANLRAMELDALVEEYWMTTQARIELIGEELRRVQAELDTRDLSDVPTAKLIEMKFKLINELARHSSAPPRILTEEQVAHSMWSRDNPRDALYEGMMPTIRTHEHRTPLFTLEAEDDGEEHKKGRVSKRASQSSQN
jgi:transposase-like protein